MPIQIESPRYAFGLPALVLGTPIFALGRREAAGEGSDRAFIEAAHQGRDSRRIHTARQEQAIGHVGTLMDPNRILKHFIQSLEHPGLVSRRSTIARRDGRTNAQRRHLTLDDFGDDARRKTVNLLKDRPGAEAIVQA